MPFIQIIEFTTSQIDEFNAVLDEWLVQTEGKRAASRGTLTRDRDRPNTYLQIVEFPSYEEAMANSDLPATSEFAARLAKLCDGPATFRNLDVTRDDHM
jgi:quinol monooxygenase YgiN